MTSIRTALVGFGVGILLPCVILAIQYASAERMAGLMQMPWFSNTVLALWPSSILLMGTHAGSSVIIPIVSVSANGILYAIVLSAISFVLNKTK